MSKKIIVFNDYPTHAAIRKKDIEMLEKYNIKYTGKDCKSEEDFIKYAKDADIIFDQGCYDITEKVLNNLSKLKAILRRGIGFDNVDYKAAAKKGICVSNTPGFCADEVSTHAVAFLLSFARNIPKYDSFIKQKKWDIIDQCYGDMESVYDENVGIVGFGNIGKSIALKLQPFNVNISVYDPFTKIDEKKYNVTKVEMKELLKKSKYIILACPLTPQTNNMLDEEEFKLMRKDTVLINVGRGKLLNEKVLIKYLKEKRIAGAALDVFSVEPVNKDNPLLELDNVILSPHNAAISPRSEELSFKMSFDEIIRIATGQAPQFRVN